jgi:phosphoribosylformylglycinamidine cyclo-ligase
LLVPHRCYLSDLRHVLPMLNGIAHITGGGIPGNVPRVLPPGLGAAIDRGAWRPPAIFRLIQEEGGIDADEMYRAFNMGLGIVLAVDPARVAEVQANVPEAFVAGQVIAGEGVVWA